MRRKTITKAETKTIVLSPLDDYKASIGKTGKSLTKALLIKPLKELEELHLKVTSSLKDDFRTKNFVDDAASKYLQKVKEMSKLAMFIDIDSYNRWELRNHKDNYRLL